MEVRVGGMETPASSKSKQESASTFANMTNDSSRLPGTVLWYLFYLFIFLNQECETSVGYWVVQERGLARDINMGTYPRTR